MATPFYPFVVSKNRTAVTSEPDSTGVKTPLNPGLDWIGYQNRGGGEVAADLRWDTNPKQYQEENGGGTRRSTPRKP